MQIEPSSLEPIAPGWRSSASAALPRSVFWIASTHVIVTITHMFVCVFPLGCIYSFINLLTNTWPDSVVLNALLVFGSLTLAFFFGIHCSLSYIRRKASTDRPAACVVTANVAFSVLGAGLAGAIVQRYDAFFFGSWPVAIAGFIAAICVLFCVITHRGFKTLGKTIDVESHGFEVVFPSQPAPPEEPQRPA